MQEANNVIDNSYWSVPSASPPLTEVIFGISTVTARPPGEVGPGTPWQSDIWVGRHGGAGMPNNAPGLTVIHQKTSRPGQTAGLPLPGRPLYFRFFHLSACFIYVLLSARRDFSEWRYEGGTKKRKCPTMPSGWHWSLRASLICPSLSLFFSSRTVYCWSST